MTQNTQPGTTSQPKMTIQPVPYGTADGSQSSAPVASQPPSYNPGDPFSTAAKAQGDAQTSNINNQTIANRADQVNPFGSSTWTKDPTTGQWTQSVGLSGQQGDALQSQEGIQAGRMAGAAGLVPGAVNSLSSPIDSSNFSKLFSFGTPGQTNQQAQDAVMGQLNPMLDQRRKAVETQLANQGITRGSEAWTNAQDQLARDENNADLQGVQAGFAQGNSLNNQNIAYGNYQSGQRAGEFQEAQGVRNQPLTDINNLTSGQGVQAPTFGQYGQAGAATAPNYLGAAQSTYNAALDSSNASADQQASLLKGLFGLGGTALGTGAGQNFLNGAGSLIGAGGSYLSNLFGLGGGNGSVGFDPNTIPVDGSGWT